jgi:uncharacterized protein (DUF305 family)
MHARTRFAALALALGAPVLLTACGGEDDTAADIPESAEFNAADVDFASGMIPHHAQALVMVDMAKGRDISPETADLMERIEAAQAPEIEQMTGWLEDWDQPVPDLGDMNDMGSGDMGDMDHSDRGDMGEMDGMTGMMSAEDMADLDAAQGSAFEQMWLSMMIEHHEGAVEMSEVELEEGEYADALALAESIIESQEAEIAEMEALLEG